MIDLCNAIALEVGYQIQPGQFRLQTTTRKAWFCSEVQELRDNSGFTSDDQFRLITARHVIDAVVLKVNAYHRSLSVPAGWTVHYASGGKPYHCKTDYKVRHAAKAAAAKLNARQGGGYAASPNHEYVAGLRGRLVRNVMSGAWIVESTGTNYSNSVASEAYWSA